MDTREKKSSIGSAHPITSFSSHIATIFQNIGFAIAQGSEVETEQYNFDALNIPPHHPARDAFDTFYINPSIGDATLLRTHTSPMQVRYALEYGAPCRVIVPGRVYRNESIDATHEAQFHQVEGLCITKKTSIVDLITILTHTIKILFGSSASVRIRPGFFPFVEPGIEMDISCTLCGGAETSSGCGFCKETGWLEILGAGMVHPRVLRAMNICPNTYQGYAFGLGVERILMIKRGIPDIRLFTGADVRFTSQ